MSAKLELPDRVYVISKVYFSENAREIWGTTFCDFYVPAIPPDEFALFVCSRDSAHYISTITEVSHMHSRD